MEQKRIWSFFAKAYSNLGFVYHSRYICC